MSLQSAFELLDKNGFQWSMFRDVFPFGDITLREGDFQKLVSRVIDYLNSDDDKELLLDMIDTQNCIFLEQVWLQNEKAETANKPFPMHGHIITAQLQITSNLRHKFELFDRNARNTMLNLDESVRLIERITQVSKENYNE